MYEYNVVGEFAFLAISILILFLMFYTKPRKTKVYILDVWGILISIVTISTHILLLYLASHPSLFQKDVFNTICMTFLILYMVILFLIFNYITLISPARSLKIRRIISIELVYGTIYSLCMFYYLCNGQLYIFSERGIHFTLYFYRYLIVGALDVVFCFISVVLNRKNIPKIVRVSTYLMVPLELMLLILQYLHPTIIFISATYVIPFTLFYFLFHSNPYDEIAGCQNNFSFETRFLDNIRFHKNYTLVHITISHLKIDGHYHFYTQKEFLAAEKCRKVEALRSGIHIYALQENSYAIFINEKKNSSTEALLQQIQEILDEPVHYRKANLQAYYNMIAFENHPSIHDFQKLQSMIRFAYQKLNCNSSLHFYHCTEKDYENFERQYRIERTLIDIRNKMDLNDARILCYTQPIYGIKQKEFRTAEALMRLQMDDEIIPPDQFIPLAEENGSIHALTCIILNKVCQKIKELSPDYNFDAITVNCSASEMADRNLHRELLDIIQKNEISYSSIRLELTESAMIHDYQNVIHNIDRLDDAGVHFYLDDFGTGYSNLERIISFPFMTIKFDKSLLYKAIKDENMNELVTSMVQIFKKKGFQLLIEGVETDEQGIYSMEHGFDYIQGYKYAHPVPLAELTNYFSPKKSNS